MIIQLDRIVMNKTEKYLKPCLKYHGEEFTNRLSLIFKLGYGIGDMLVDKKYEQHIFVLVDTLKCVQFWTEFIEDYFRELDFYEDDYAVDNLENGRLHMLVIKLPDNCIDKKNEFVKGRYSKMYSNDEIQKLLKAEDTKAIVVKDSNYRVEFVKKINDYFKTNLKESELAADAELDFPPDIEENKETFNKII